MAHRRADGCCAHKSRFWRLWALFVVILCAVDGPLSLGFLDGVEQLVAGLGDDGSPQLLAQQHVPRLGQLARHRVVVTDQQPLEERQIELPSYAARRFAVSALAVTGPRQRALQVRLGFAEVSRDLGQSPFDGFDGRRNPFLLALEQIERHGSGVVGVQQRLALVLELAQPPLLRLAFALSVEPELRQFFAQEGPQRRNLSLRELHRAVIRGDGLLCLIYADGSLIAARLVALASRADEIGVGAAVAFGVAHEQASAALAAVDAPSQVVAVLAVLLPGEVLGGQQLLDVLPRLRRHQQLMLAGVDHSPVAHHAHVVGIAQQLVQMGDSQRLASPLARRGCQPARRQLGQQAADRPLTALVCLKRPPHQRPAHRIDFHRSDLAPINDFPNVQVASRCPARRAAALRLLHRALDDLVSEVATVELGNRGHDPVQQQTGGSLVDVLRDRHQLDPGLLECQVDRHIIGTVTRQPINLMHDDVLDVMLSDVGEHPLQLRPISGLGRLAALHELFDHGRAQALRLAFAALALRRNGEPLGFAALLGLLFARHPQVDHGRSGFETVSFGSHTHRPQTVNTFIQRRLHIVVKCTTLTNKVTCCFIRLPAAASPMRTELL